MRLEFTILWFENQPEDLRTQIDELREHIGDVGFIPKIRMEPNADNLASLSKDQTLFNDYDLVVVDYNLGVPGKDGDHVAQLVRRTFGFTDIIFYSGIPTGELRRLVHDKQIDGVYCLSRPALYDGLVKHVDQVVARLSRLESMRGLVMGTVGKCDDMLTDILLDTYRQCSELQKAEILETLDEYVKNAAVAHSRKYARCDGFKEKLYSRAVTSFHLQKLALHVTRGIEKYGSHRQVLKKYTDVILRPRNVLGHVVEERHADGWRIVSDGDLSITSEEFPELRRNLVRHLENLRSLATVIRS